MNLANPSALFLAAALLSYSASAQETEISRKDVPPVVLAAFNKVYGSAKVLEWEKEIHGGKLYYEAETVDGKVSRNILYSPDGTVAQVAAKITPQDLPAAVMDSMKVQFPNATVRSAYKVTHADTVEYGLSLSGSKQKKGCDERGWNRRIQRREDSP